MTDDLGDMAIPRPRRPVGSLHLRVALTVAAGLAAVTAAGALGSGWMVTRSAREHARTEARSLARTFGEVVAPETLADPAALGRALRGMLASDRRLLDVTVISRQPNGRLRAVDARGGIVHGPFEPTAVAPLSSGHPTSRPGARGVDAIELNHPLPTTAARPSAVVSLAYDLGPARARASRLHRRLVLGMTAVAIVVALLLLVILRRSLQRPLASLARESEAMADTIERQQARLEMSARTDELTGLATRRELVRRVEVELAGASSPDLAVLLFEVADVSTFNVRWGQAVGDEALRAVAVEVAARGKGVVAGRISGSTFGLVVRGAESAIRRRATAVRLAIEALEVHGEPLACTAGYAIATSPHDFAAILVERAQAALGWAKEEGGATVRGYDHAQPRCLAPHERRADVEAVLADPDGMKMVLQPIASLSSGTIVGFEALARFVNGRRPDVMFEQAHLCGLGPRLEAEAVRRAVAITERPAGTYLSVNASASAIRSPEFAAALPDDLSELVIEITEREDVATDAETLARLADLRARGARLAIDDVGAGYAGLTQVMALRPEVVKLDRALIQGLDGDSDKRALVEAMVRFTHRAGARLCAEGIETLDELRAATELDVELGQGYLLARPAEPWPDLDRVTAIACRAARDDALAGRRLSCDLRDGVDDAERFAEELAAALTPEDIVRAVQALARTFGAQHGVLSIGDESSEAGVLPAARRALEHSLPVQVHVGDPAIDALDGTVLAQAGYGSALVVPVVRDDRAIGVLALYARESRPFRRSEIARARLAAHQVALAVAALSRDEVTASPHGRGQRLAA